MQSTYLPLVLVPSTLFSSHDRHDMMRHSSHDRPPSYDADNVFITKNLDDLTLSNFPQILIGRHFISEAMF